MSDKPVRAVLWDFGGVITESPFVAFARHEREMGLPDGFIRSLNTRNPDTNAWAKFERDEIDLDAFCPLFERSEEHTSELQSLMRISYAVFCLKKKKTKNQQI